MKQISSVYIICGNITLKGGTEKAISNLTQLLETHNIKTYIISLFSKDGELSSYNTGKSTIIHLAHRPFETKILKRILWYTSIIRELRSILANTSKNIILGYGHNINIMLPFLRGAKNKYYGYEHIDLNSIPFSSRLIQRLVYPYMDGLIVLSTKAKNKYIKYNKNIFVIPNTVSFRYKRFTDYSSNRILMIGRLSPEKGYDRLIPIGEMIAKKFPGWEIDIFGEGDLKNDIIKNIKEHHLENIIHLAGFTNDIQTELVNSCVLIMLSYSEALPMVIIEAKACGIPCIAYKCEGTEALINDSIDGFIVETQEEFINKLSLMLYDKSMLKNMGMRALENAKNFSDECIYSKWKVLLKE